MPSASRQEGLHRAIDGAGARLIEMYLAARSVRRVRDDHGSFEEGAIGRLGFVEDIADLWASAHIAVLPSHREGIPLSLLEAAACRRPLVATDLLGCRDIARPGVNALLVPVEDAEALANAIERLAFNSKLRRRFGAAGRQLAEAQFSSKRIGDELVDLHRRLLARTT